MSDPIEDVCVVGAGPVGLASAIALSRQGYHVTAVDCATPPIDKACGEGLMPEGIQALASLGVELDPQIGRSFQRHSFLLGTFLSFSGFPGCSGIGSAENAAARCARSKSPGLRRHTRLGCQTRAFS